MQSMQPRCFVVTCEHGGNEVPRPYLRLFRGNARVLLKTHRGYDFGALEMGRDLADALAAPFFFPKRHDCSSI